MDHLDLTFLESIQELLNDDALELCLFNGEDWGAENPSVSLVANQLDENIALRKNESFEDMNRSTIQRAKPSTEEPPEVELKQLPDYLQYAFLEKNSKLPVIIELELSQI